MRTKAKKLGLSRETVRNLSRVELGKVAGGTDASYAYNCATGANCTGSGGCSIQCWSDPDYSCQQNFDPSPTSDC